MSRTTLRRVLLVLALICFVITIATTEYVLTATATGIAIGYAFGITGRNEENR